MRIPDNTWIARCRLWVRLLDLLATNPDASEAGDVFACNLDARYMELMNDAYAGGRRDGFEAGQKESAETILTLRQQIAALEKSLSLLTGSVPDTQEPTTLH